MKRCKTMQAFGLFGVTALVLLCAVRSAVAQDLTETEQRIVQELEKSQQGLNSWKCTGITTFQSSQSFRDKLNSASQKLSAKHGMTPPTNELRHGFDRIQAFFCATRGDKMLCAEEELTVSPETYTPPVADVKALNDFVATGHTQVYDRGRNYSVDGERRGLTFHNLTSHRVILRNSTGFVTIQAYSASDSHLKIALLWHYSTT